MYIQIKCVIFYLSQLHLLHHNALTVNVVIFAGRKFRENVGKTFHVGVIFMKLLLFSS